jgi:hypothetical protein
MRISRLLPLALGLCAAAPLVGCAKRFPEVVPTSGVVVIDGKPLANASVTFVPMLDHFGAESYATGVTDEQGHFTLTCRYNNRPGAAAGQNVVLVAEAPLPDDVRKSQDSRVQAVYEAKLGNRPIPPAYGTVGTSPLKVEVKPGQGELTLTLTR